MIKKQLFLMFPGSSYKDGLLLLVSPGGFHKLEGNTMEGMRLFMLVCEGCLEMDLNGKPYKMEGPAFLDVMDTATVRIREASPGLRAWCLFVAFEFASESLKNIRPGYLSRLMEKPFIPIWNLPQEEKDTLERQLALLEETLGNKGHYYRQELLAAYFRSFTLELGNIMHIHEGNMDDAQPYISKKDFITLNFMKLVSRHATKEHNVGFYAGALCVSVKHLTRIIKEMAGKTPHDIICSELVLQAMAMLEDDSIPVSLIAERLHFSDQAAFCKFFKKHKNVAPMSYRRRKGE